MSDNELELTIKELIATNKKLAHGVPLWRAFLVGTVGGIGASIGAAIVIALLSTALNGLSAIEIFKPVIQPVLPYVKSNQNNSYDDTEVLPSPVYASPLPTPSNETDQSTTESN